MAFRTSKTENTNFATPQEMFQDNKMKNIMGLIDYQSKTLDHYMDTLDKNGNIINRHVAFELPTGSGKTLIGLLIAEYHRRKYNRRTLFLCPTNQLVMQVYQQAIKQYGIDAVAFCGSQSEYSPADKSAYMLSKKVGITTYSSFFASSEYFDKTDILIFDDVHSSENYIANGWTLDIQRTEHSTLYFELVEFFRDIIGEPDYTRMVADSPYSSDIYDWCNMIPRPALLTKMQVLHSIIAEGIKDTQLQYSWNRISDHLGECNFFISWDSILIRPYISPTKTFSPFCNAKQCVFMSATLGKSGELERITGVDKIKILPMVNDWDKKGLGRKFFVFPDLSFEEKYHVGFIVELHKIAKKSAVIVPSLRDQNELSEIVEKELPNTQVFTANDLSSSKDNFIQSDEAMAIIANRFDGIDFPDDECRMLIIYNLPKVTHLQEKFFYSKMAASVLYSERVKTRIVQAVGRCTRNAKDYAVVCILGHTVLNELVSGRNLQDYKPEMRAEIQFGINNSTELIKASELFENIRLFLSRDPAWQDAEDDIVHLRDEYVLKGEDNQKLLIYKKLHCAAIKEVQLQYSLWQKDYMKSFELLTEIIAELDAPLLSGYKSFWQYYCGSIGLQLGAAYEPKAKLLFQNAAKNTLGITWLAQLAKAYPDENIVDTENYFNSIIERFESFLNAVRSSKHLETKITETLRGISEGSGTTFENYHTALGTMLGYLADNPTEDGSPDPYWIINDDLCIVAEDKVYDADSKKIPLDHVTQAKRHETWIRKNISSLRDTATIYTVFVTNATAIEDSARIHAEGIFYCSRNDFAAWANSALSGLRTCYTSFSEEGNPEWRQEAKRIFEQAGITPLDFINLISKQQLSDL